MYMALTGEYAVYIVPKNRVILTHLGPESLSMDDRSVRKLRL